MGLRAQSEPHLTATVKPLITHTYFLKDISTIPNGCALGIFKEHFLGLMAIERVFQKFSSSPTSPSTTQEMGMGYERFDCMSAPAIVGSGCAVVGASRRRCTVVLSVVVMMLIMVAVAVIVAMVVVVLVVVDVMGEAWVWRKEPGLRTPVARCSRNGL
jgi:hypothetical protein